MSIKEIIQRLQIAMDDARGQESHFESWLTQNEAICCAIDALKEKEWIGLTEQDLVAINQSCSTKLSAAISSESILKEKNK